MMFISDDTFTVGGVTEGEKRDTDLTPIQIDASTKDVWLFPYVIASLYTSLKIYKYRFFHIFNMDIFLN